MAVFWRLSAKPFRHVRARARSRQAASSRAATPRPENSASTLVFVMNRSAPGHRLTATIPTRDSAVQASKVMASGEFLRILADIDPVAERRALKPAITAGQVRSMSFSGARVHLKSRSSSMPIVSFRSKESTDVIQLVVRSQAILIASGELNSYIDYRSMERLVAEVLVFEGLFSRNLRSIPWAPKSSFE